MSRVPWALAVIILATFVVLFLMTGSIVIPIKALVLNTLSLGASFGALVWVFQDGHLAGLIGTEALGSLSITTPVLVFAIAFGLSMDYEVFLLGRISEEWRRTGDTDLAVEIGLQRTGRVVTAAALLMITVYAAFVAGGFAPIKQVGLGLVLAVLIDATLYACCCSPRRCRCWARATGGRRRRSAVGTPASDGTRKVAQPRHRRPGVLLVLAPRRRSGLDQSVEVAADRTTIPADSAAPKD